MALILVNPVARWSGLSLLVSITLAHDMTASSVAPTCDRKRTGTLAQYGEIATIAEYPTTPSPCHLLDDPQAAPDQTTQH